MALPFSVSLTVFLLILSSTHSSCHDGGSTADGYSAAQNHRDQVEGMQHRVIGRPFGLGGSKTSHSLRHRGIIISWPFPPPDEGDHDTATHDFSAKAINNPSEATPKTLHQAADHHDMTATHDWAKPINVAGEEPPPPKKPDVVYVVGPPSGLPPRRGGQ